MGRTMGAGQSIRDMQEERRLREERSRLDFTARHPNILESLCGEDRRARQRISEIDRHLRRP